MDSVAAALPVLLSRSRYQYINCTTPSLVCPVESSYYYYRIDLGANVAFAALFGLSVLGFLIAFITTRRALAFSVAMLSGTILEVIGYAGRLISWKNQWSENGFLIQIVCLTIAPAFMAAGLYLCLRRIVYTFGPENSRIKPETYTRLVRPLPLRLPPKHHMLTCAPTVHPLRSPQSPSTSSRRRHGLYRNPSRQEP
jgi:hypothetical protein